MKYSKSLLVLSIFLMLGCGETLTEPKEDTQIVIDENSSRDDTDKDSTNDTEENSTNNTDENSTNNTDENSTNDTEEDSTNDTEEDSTNNTDENSTNDTEEDSTNDTEEDSTNNTDENSTNDTEEDSTNDTEEDSTNDTEEDSTNDTEEDSTNDTEEDSTNDTEEDSTNDTEEDSTKPIITLVGDASVTLTEGDNYIDAGARASDDIDGNITLNIQIHNPVNVNTVGTYRITYDVNDSVGNSAVQVERSVIVEAEIIIPDTTAPNVPTLSSRPQFSNQENVILEVNGEANAILFVNTLSSGQLNSMGVLNASLDISGEDGLKDFNLSLKDSSTNESPILNIKITKDTLAPAQNSTIDNLHTDDTSPALSGNFPSGDEDSNTTNYSIYLKIDNEVYEGNNDKDGTWSIADDTIATLEIGIYDVNITVTDEANNSSYTFLAGKIEIDNTGFLIDSAIEGIRYISGAYHGYTDKDGLFKYDKGAGVTFYIGDESTGISLGMATEKIDPHNANRRIITIFDLAGTQDENNTRVINMGKLLQSLDSDNDVSNGISIDERTKESITLLGLQNRIDFNMNVEDFHNHNDIYELFNDLAGHFGEHRGLVDTEDAKAHMVSIRDNTLATKSYDVAKVSGKKEIIKVLGGIFQSVGGVVEGLEYRSGNQFGRTDSNGAFKYEEGKKIKFYIYQLELGITQGKAVITPADLVPSSSFNHPKPRNIIRLLNAFDKPNTANIEIDDAVREALEKYRSQIDINLPDGKANTDLGIPQGADEFGGQFEDFEMGKEILDEIDSIRGTI